MKESLVGKLKRQIGESEEIRKGNLSGKKKEVAKKMKSGGAPTNDKGRTDKGHWNVEGHNARGKGSFHEWYSSKK